MNVPSFKSPTKFTRVDFELKADLLEMAVGFSFTVIGTLAISKLVSPHEKEDDDVYIPHLLLSSGGCNSTPQSRGLSNRHLFLTVLRAGSQISVPAQLGSCEDYVSGYVLPWLSLVHAWREH